MNSSIYSASTIDQKIVATSNIRVEKHNKNILREDYARLLAKMKGQAELENQNRYSEAGTESIMRIMPNGAVVLTVYRGAEVVSREIIQEKEHMLERTNLGEPLNIGTRISCGDISAGLLAALG